MSDESLEVLPEDVFSGRAIPPEMIRDLRAIAQLDARTIGRVVEHLSQLKGLKVTESIKDGIQKCLPNEGSELADIIVRTLLNVRPSEVTRIVKTVDRWRQSTIDRKAVLTDEQFISIERNLQILVGKYPSVELIRKANRLLREVGNEFKSVDFFCDMRPIFDEPREKVEGFVSIANLRLMYASQDGERHACELALTEDELSQLIEKGQKALSKMRVIKATGDQLGPKL